METPVNAPFKEKVRLEFAKLREMTFKNKMEHIWEYYKFHIICFLTILFVVIGLLNVWVFNPKPDAALFISWNSGFATDEQVDRLAEVLGERLVEDGAREVVEVAQFYFSNNDPSVSMASAQRLVAMLSTGMIDLFILDHDLLENYSTSGFLMPLDTVLAEIKTRNPEVHSRIEENVVSMMCEVDVDVVERRMVGIKIGNSPLFTELGMFSQGLFLSVSATSGKFENVVEAMIMFFE